MKAPRVPAGVPMCTKQAWGPPSPASEDGLGLAHTPDLAEPSCTDWPMERHAGLNDPRMKACQEPRCSRDLRPVAGLPKSHPKPRGAPSACKAPVTEPCTSCFIAVRCFPFFHLPVSIISQDSPQVTAGYQTDERVCVCTCACACVCKHPSHSLSLPVPPLLSPSFFFEV